MHADKQSWLAPCTQGAAAQSSLPSSLPPSLPRPSSPPPHSLTCSTGPSDRHLLGHSGVVAFVRRVPSQLGRGHAASTPHPHRRSSCWLHNHACGPTTTAQHTHTSMLHIRAGRQGHTGAREQRQTPRGNRAPSGQRRASGPPATHSCQAGPLRACLGSLEAWRGP